MPLCCLCCIPILQETLQWNGTTSKKKGQKWGREKTLSKKSDDDYCNGAFNENMITEEGEHVDDHINFESLFPLTRLPEVCSLIFLYQKWVDNNDGFTLQFFVFLTKSAICDIYCSLVI